jgi:N-acyl-D-aspartate/D-glutamate deacylase
MELIEAASVSGAKLQISHIAHQLAFKTRSYGSLVDRGLALIEQARKDGVDVMADCLPIAWNGADISQPFMDMVLSPAAEKYYGVKCEDILEIVDGPHKGTWLTRERFGQIRKKAPNTPLKIHLMQEDLLIRTLLPPYVMVSSDSADNGLPAQLIVLGRMVRELKVLTLMDALYKLSTLPALRLGLVAKGRIAVGADADLVAFNANTIAGIDQYPEPSEIRGMVHVVVNGVPVVQNAKRLNQALPGRALRYRPWQ